MNKLLLFLSLFVLTFCAEGKKKNKAMSPFEDMKVKILDCIIEKEEVGENLKAYAKSLKDSPAEKKLNFRGIDLGEKDRQIIRECRRGIFRGHHHDHRFGPFGSNAEHRPDHSHGPFGERPEHRRHQFAKPDELNNK